MKKFIARVFLLVTLFSLSGLVASAQTNEEIKKAELWQKIEILSQELRHLQTLLNKQSQLVSKEADGSYQLAIFKDVPVEAKYFVEDLTLKKADNSAVRSIDQDLFNLFVAILGKEAVSSQVGEWRVFNNSEDDLGAFVELVSGTDKWVVAVNRDGYDRFDQHSRQAMADLFIHEYAHLLLFNDKDFVAKYKSKYWSESDQAQADYLEKVSSTQRFDLALDYFYLNEDRFVSDYATHSVDEDLAETFVSFVLNEKPNPATVKDFKIREFYLAEDFVSARSVIRENLRTNNLLF